MPWQENDQKLVAHSRPPTYFSCRIQRYDKKLRLRLRCEAFDDLGSFLDILPYTYPKPDFRSCLALDSLHQTRDSNKCAATAETAKLTFSHTKTVIH
jgi:hypothetical protein